MKLFNKLFLGVVSAMAFSCSNDYNGVFDKAPDERIGELVSKYTEVLQNSEYGWMGHYYSFPGELGAETMVFKFRKDGTYIMNWSVRDEEDEASYSIKAIEKPLLSFDTYSNFTKFADPVMRRDGEQEFSILGVSENGDTVFMEERIKKEPFNLIKCNVNSWTDIHKLRSQRNSLIRERETEARPFYYVLDVEGWDSEMLLTYDDNRMLASLFYEENGEVVRETMSINFSPEGFDFMVPVERNGIKVRTFVYDSATRTHSVADKGIIGKFSYKNEITFQIKGVGDYYFGPNKFGGNTKYSSLNFFSNYKDLPSVVGSPKKYEYFSYTPYKAFSSLNIAFEIDSDPYTYYSIDCLKPTFEVFDENKVRITCAGFAPQYNEGFTQEQIDIMMSSEKGESFKLLFFSEKGWTIVPFSLEREYSSAFFMVSNEDPTIFFAFGEIAEDEE